MRMWRVLCLSSALVFLCPTAAPASSSLATRPRHAATLTASTRATAIPASHVTPSVLFAATGGDTTRGDYGSLLRRGGGPAWQRVWSSTGLSALAISQDGAVLYVGHVGDGNVVRSREGGHQWQTTRLGAFFVRTLAVDPRNGAIVYAGTAGGPYKTTDGGRSWHALTRGLPRLLDVWGLAVDRRHPTHLWIGGMSSYDASDPGLYHSEDGGTTWTAVPFFSGQAGPSNVVALALSPLTSRVIFVGTPTGLYRSSDGGSTWRQLPLRLDVSADSNEIASLAVSDVVPTLVYVGVQPDQSSATNAPLLYRSLDGGATWVPGRGLPPDGRPRTLLADPALPFVAYVGVQNGGLYRTTDAGATWQPWTGGPLTSETDIISLVAVPSQHTPATPPASPIVLPPPTSTSLPSTPTALPTSTPTSIPVKTTWLRVDPRHPRTVYVGGSFDCPDPTNTGGVCSDWALRSTDGGQSWADLRGPLHVLLAPYDHGLTTSIFPPLLGSDGRHVYLELTTNSYGDAASIIPNHLMSSQDNGVQWEDDHSPPNTGSYIGLSLSPLSPTRLYAVSDSALSNDTWLSSSADGGRRWRSLTNPQDSLGSCRCSAVTLVPDPRRVNTVYANVLPIASPPLPSYAVARSEDGGLTWTRVITPAAATASGSFAVRTDPHDPGLIVGTVDDGRAPSVRRYLSADAGRTWRVGNCPGGLPGVGCPSVTVDNVFGAGASYAFYTRGLYRFHGSGLAEARLSLSEKLPVSPANVLDVQAGLRPGDPIYVLAKGMDDLRDGLLYRSSDAGRSWQRLMVGIPLTLNALLPVVHPPSP